jgi:hypothetical protein
LYTYHDDVTGKEVEVLRDVELIEERPTLEEALGQNMTEEEFTNAKWVRYVGRNITTVRGANWKGMKGHW